jgi:DNA repair protein RadC
MVKQNLVKEKNSIKYWSEDDRPREKLLLKGKNILSDAELIAILIGSGNKDESAVELSKKILNYVDNNLISLSKLSINELMKFKGIGEAKAVSIVAALELGSRRRESDVIIKDKISGSKDVFELFTTNFSNTDYEEFWILMLNRANRIINKINISEGGLSGTVVDPKKVFRYALENKASSIVLCHNHPSGNIQPSEADVKLTKKIKDAGTALDINVVDHIIIGNESYYSFSDEGIL